MKLRRKYSHIQKRISTGLLILAGIGFSGSLTAQTFAESPTPANQTYDSTLAYFLVALAIILLLVIAILGRVLIVAAKIRLDREKQARVRTAGLMIVFMAMLQQGVAQKLTGAMPPADSRVTASSIYWLLVIIGTELIVILFLALQTNGLLRNERAAVAAKPSVTKKWLNWLYRKNTEEDLVILDLGHNYDGIRELDNNIPVWWKLAFAGSILFGAVYLFRYHISNTAPLQQAELKIALMRAEEDKAAYLQTAADHVDEKTVQLLGAADIAEGKELFHKPGACLSCHGDNGSGIVNGAAGVGPNLTDNYWLHKGSINDVFYSIKYGWPEKGMRSWKEDYTPLQIAKLASYIKSISGIKHAAAKEPQGEMEVAGNSGAAADTIKNTPK